MIQRLLCDRTPDQLKLGFALWNRQPVAQLVQAQLGVQLPVRTVGHYLKRWGFTPQQPIKKAQEPRPAEVQRWLRRIRGLRAEPRPKGRRFIGVMRPGSARTTFVVVATGPRGKRPWSG